jgi:hypothetical protein
MPVESEFDEAASESDLDSVAVSDDQQIENHGFGAILGHLGKLFGGGGSSDSGSEGGNEEGGDSNTGGGIDIGSIMNMVKGLFGHGGESLVDEADLDEATIATPDSFVSELDEAGGEEEDQVEQDMDQPEFVSEDAEVMPESDDESTIIEEEIPNEENIPIPNLQGGADDDCTSVKGRCTTSCTGGTFRSGLCPGAASVRCCVPNGTPNPPPSSGNKRGSIKNSGLSTAPSYRRGCPVTPDKLSEITFPYLDINGNRKTQTSLIVSSSVANEFLDIMQDLYNAGFRLAEPVLGYACRPNTSNPGAFSNHSWGLAVDINPQQNPYYNPRTGQIVGKRSHINRRSVKGQPGVIDEGGAVVKAFTSRGWQWGGSWTSVKDYMHFEKK